MKQSNFTGQGPVITDRSDSLNRYLQEIGKEDFISPEEEVILFKRIKKGDIYAIQKLTRANLRFVVSVAKQYQHRGLPLSDLINEGNLGLIKAAETFDVTRGFKFITHAVYGIREMILLAIAENSKIVRLPLHQWGYINRINRAFSALEQYEEREPTSEELADFTSLPLNVIETSFFLRESSLSLDEPIYHDNEFSLLDKISGDGRTDKNLMQSSLSDEIEMMLSGLPDRNADIVRMFFGLKDFESMSAEEISYRSGLTDVMVRKIKRDFVSKIQKSPQRRKILRKYLS
jgi:RNA polymerase primary sigma factor